MLIFVYNLNYYILFPYNKQKLTSFEIDNCREKNNDFCPTPPLLELDNCWQTSNELVILSEEFECFKWKNSSKPTHKYFTPLLTLTYQAKDRVVQLRKDSFK